jgi:hypothetical protein
MLANNKTTFCSEPSTWLSNHQSYQEIKYWKNDEQRQTNLDMTLLCEFTNVKDYLDIFSFGKNKNNSVTVFD